MGQKARLRRVVLDTNVVISALLFPGPARRLAELWTGGRIEILASAGMIRELSRVLAYGKFQLSEDDISALLHEEVLPYITPIAVEEIIPVIEADPSDDEFLACALKGRADAIVSGDDHLLRLDCYRDIPILSVRSMLERMG